MKEAWRNKDHKLKKRVEKTEFARCVKKDFERETLRGLELRPDLLYMLGRNGFDRRSFAKQR